MKVTLFIDDAVVAEARRVAADRGTDLDALVHDFLSRLTGAVDTESAVAELDALWGEESWRSCRSWTREELHERS